MTTLRFSFAAAVLAVLCSISGRAGAQAIAWVVAKQPTSPSYSPSARDQFNAAGKTNTVTRVGVGKYVVSFPGLSAKGSSGVVHLSPYGGQRRCRVLGYTNADRVEIDCGVDHAFVALYYSERSGLSEHTGAYLVADQETRSVYAPDASRSYNSAGAGNLITRKSPGEYEIQLGRIASLPGWPERELAFVTNYGPGAGHCFPHQAIFEDNRNVKLWVSCGGRDSKFILSYLRDAKLGTPKGKARTGAFMTKNHQYVTGFGPPHFATRLTSPGNYAVLLDPVPGGTQVPPGVALIRPEITGDCWPVSWTGSPFVELNIGCVSDDGQPTSFADFKILYVTAQQGGAVVTKRPVGCRASEDNHGCRQFGQCDANTRILSARIACNLEFGEVSDAALAAVPDHRIRVLKASENVADGFCWVTGMKYNSSEAIGPNVKLSSGESSIGGLYGRQTVEVGCREMDQNGGDCHVRGELTCTY